MRVHLARRVVPEASNVVSEGYSRLETFHVHTPTSNQSKFWRRPLDISHRMLGSGPTHLSSNFSLVIDSPVRSIAAFDTLGMG